MSGLNLVHVQCPAEEDKHGDIGVVLAPTHVPIQLSHRQDHVISIIAENKYTDPVFGEKEHEI